MLIYKLFIDLYYDNFETFRNIYHLLKGVYIKFENMSTYQRKLIKNYFIFRFILFGDDFNKFLKLFISKMKKFEKEKIIKVNGQNTQIIISLDIITFNLPQENDIIRVLRYNVNKGYRTCIISKNSLLIIFKIYLKYQDIIILLMINLMKY